LFFINVFDPYGKKAEDFIKKIKNAEGKDAQLIMAKITGNFKRGNERR